MDERKSSNSPAMSEHEGPAPPPSADSGMPALGNSLQFLPDASKLLNDSYPQPRPVYRLRALRVKHTAIGDAETRERLPEGLDEKLLARQPFLGPFGASGSETDLFHNSSGERQTGVRQLLSVAFSRQVASPWVPQLIQSVRAQVARCQPGAEYGVMEQVERLAFKQQCLVMAGHPLVGYYRDCLRLANYSPVVGDRPWPEFMYRGSWYRVARDRVLGLIRNLVQERRTAGPIPGRPPTIMDTLLRMTDAQGRHLTDDEIALYSLYGITDSCSELARVVGFMLYELLQHPEVMEQVNQEIEHAFAEGINDATDVRKLRLLQAVYHETLRAHPVSQGPSFYATQDFEYAGKRIKKGDLVVWSQAPESGFHRGSEPSHAFDPACCLEPRSDRVGTMLGLTELMAVTLLATLLHEVRFTLAPATYRLRLAAKPLPAPDAGFRIRVDAPPVRDESAPRPAILVEEHVLASYSCLAEPRVQRALAAAKTQYFPAGTPIIQQGERASAFYVLVRGSAQVSHTDKGVTHPLGRLREGDYFGEIGLLQNIPRTATVTAGDEGAETLVIDRETFLDVVAASDLVTEELARIIQKRVARQRLLEAWPSLSPESLERVMADFDSQTYAAGATIIREGDDANHFFILAEGEVVVSREARSGNDEEVARLHPGEYFGEMGLLYRAPRKATVTVSSSGPAKVLVTDRAGFQKLLGGTGGMRADLARAMLGRVRQLAQHRS